MYVRSVLEIHRAIIQQWSSSDIVIKFLNFRTSNAKTSLYIKTDLQIFTNSNFSVTLAKVYAFYHKSTNYNFLAPKKFYYMKFQKFSFNRI